MKHRRAYGETKASGPRDPGGLPGKDKVVGKEVNKTPQESAEQAVRGTAAAKDNDRTSAGIGVFDRVVHARYLIHDRGLNAAGQVG